MKTRYQLPKNVRHVSGQGYLLLVGGKIRIIEKSDVDFLRHLEIQEFRGSNNGFQLEFLV